MTTYYANDFIENDHFQSLTRALRLIAPEILEYPKYRCSNPKKLKLLLTDGIMHNANKDRFTPSNGESSQFFFGSNSPSPKCDRAPRETGP